MTAENENKCGAEAMMDLRAAIVCKSPHHGNTLKVAEVVAGVLQAAILSPDALSAQALSHYDVLGWGSGIYFGRHHPELLRLARAARRLPKHAFIFSTAGSPRLARLWHRALRRRLIVKGCEITGEFACRGWDTVGPLRWIGGMNRGHPDARDLAAAAAFAHCICSSLKGQPAHECTPI
jgi:flavodoxin